MTLTESKIDRFLERWSRRKRLAMRRGGNALGAAADVADDDQDAFDLSRLPPIEDIKAATDLRAFLAPGVPVELTRAALRRAWTADPAIRDFVEIAENQWDFGKPRTVPGFGSLDVTPELRRLVEQLCGDPPDGGEAGSESSEQGMSKQPAEDTDDGG